MVRVMVQFTEEQHRRLKERARQSGKSVSAVVRESVDKEVAPVKVKRDPETIKRMLSVVGKFHSDRHDVSINHDEYFAEAIESEWRSS